ncbi:MAG: LysM peptidoglycan-binding domain-containing protein [Lachnospiraceae bacterium]|nr:LysM peptidoglycan-binding domain-containing protein [Lachnospiraceae bacterium]
MPEGTAIYVVRRGDTVDSIAAAYGVDVETIIRDNQIIYPYELALGQALFIDLGTRQPYRSLRVTGYAYPYINETVLADTLPYLSELAIFSYGFTTQGRLLPPALPDDWMIEMALQNGTAPILTLTPLDEQGRFSNYLIHNVVQNQEAVNQLIDNLLETMAQKGYQGVDIDFEYILAEDREAFTDFVWQVAERMRANGYHTSVALAPKTSADQKGVLYEGKDYRALGEAADHVLLMTYEWGYTYGPPMAVAPLNQVRRVVEYAVSEIPPQKIDLGIPNYGYDWPLPFVKGETKATSIGNVQAVRIAIEQDVPIQFDEVAQSPFFTYTQAGENAPQEGGGGGAVVSQGSDAAIEHEVWFEDVRSLQGKFDLIREFDLGGCGYWQIMRWFAANWRLLYKNFYTEK